MIPSWLEVTQKTRGLFLMTDPGRDQDDEDVLVMLNRYIRRNNLEVLGVTANLEPPDMRARLAGGTLDELGLQELAMPVGIGTDCTEPPGEGLDYQFAVGYLWPEDHPRLEDGSNLITRTLKEAPDKGLVLLLISGMTDAAEALARDPDLFTAKVRRVVIMGGVETNENQVLLDRCGFLKADPTAQNNKFDLDSAKFLYRSLQMFRIPMTIVTRHAATAARVPRSMYDRMADTGHAVGKRLQTAQKKAIQELWERTHMALNNPNRRLPERCSPSWFCGAFLGGEGLELSGEDEIWPLVKTFNLYDPVTLIAAVPSLRSYFFRPAVVEVLGTEHAVIGVSKDRHGVIDGAELAEYMTGSLVSSLEASMASPLRLVSNG